MNVPLFAASLLMLSLAPVATAESGCTHTELVFVDSTPPTYVVLANCTEDYFWTYTTPDSLVIPGCGTVPEVRVLGVPVPGTGANCGLGLPVPQQSDSGSGTSSTVFVCVAVQMEPTCVGLSGWTPLLDPGCTISMMRLVEPEGNECYYYPANPYDGLP